MDRLYQSIGNEPDSIREKLKTVEQLRNQLKVRRENLSSFETFLFLQEQLEKRRTTLEDIHKRLNNYFRLTTDVKNAIR